MCKTMKRRKRELLPKTEPLKRDPIEDTEYFRAKEKSERPHSMWLL